MLKNYLSIHSTLNLKDQFSSLLLKILLVPYFMSGNIKKPFLSIQEISKKGETLLRQTGKETVQIVLKEN